MRLRTRTLLTSFFAAAGLMALAAAPALAQFPSKPIKLIVPFPAGSATDVAARVIGSRSPTPSASRC